jgi:hypothetical protein
VSTPAPIVKGLTIEAAPRRRFSGDVATFNSSVPVAAGTFSALIDWGDGSSSPGTVVASAGGTSFTVNGLHRYAHRGPYSGAVTLISSDGTRTVIPIVAEARPGLHPAGSARRPADRRTLAPRPDRVPGSAHPRGPLGSFGSRAAARTGPGPQWASVALDVADPAHNGPRALVQPRGQGRAIRSRGMALAADRMMESTTRVE